MNRIFESMKLVEDYVRFCVCLCVTIRNEWKTTTQLIAHRRQISIRVTKKPPSTSENTA